MVANIHKFPVPQEHREVAMWWLSHETAGARGASDLVGKMSRATYYNLPAEAAQAALEVLGREGSVMHRVFNGALEHILTKNAYPSRFNPWLQGAGFSTFVEPC